MQVKPSSFFFLFLIFFIGLFFPYLVWAADGAAFVSENYADGTDVQVGSVFNKQWTFRNSGNTVWNNGYCLRYVSNNGGFLSQAQGNVCVQGSVNPGQQYTFSIPMRMPVAPRNGAREDWRFTNGAGTTIRVDLSNTVWILVDVVCFVNSSLTVVNPNGGDTWYKGRDYNVQWASTGTINSLHIHLYKAGQFLRALSNAANNTGNFAYTVEGNLVTAGDYKIGISAVGAGQCDGVIADFSNNNFTFTDPPAFAAPAISAPANASNNVVLTPRLDWGDIASDQFGPGPDAYRVQIATDVNFNNIVRDQTINGSPPNSFYNVPAGILNNNVTYYWRVRASNAFRVGAWASARFTTDPCNLAGASLTVTTPNGGESWTRGNAYTIKWDAAGAISNVSLKLYKNGNFLSTISNSTLNDGGFDYAVPANFSAANDYKIYISNVDNVAQCSGQVTDQSNNNFSISNPPNLPAPILVSPVNGTSGVSKTPALDWGDVAGATNYQLDVASDNAFGNIVTTQMPANSSWNVPNGLLNYGARYYWRVKALDNVRDGNWSGTFNFTVQLDPVAAGTLVSEDPVDGTLLNPRQGFVKRWTLRNSGSVKWNANFHFHHVLGNMSNNSNDIPLGVTVNSGSTYDFLVPMTAPLSGQNVEDRWQLLDGSNNIVQISGSNTIYARINVGNVTHLAEFVGENPLDGNKYLPGQAFTKSWTLRNIGNAPWDNAFILRRKAGGSNFSLANQVSVANAVAMGNNYVFNVNAKAPGSVGNYREEWELVDSTGQVVRVRAPDNSWVSSAISVAIVVEKGDQSPDSMPPTDTVSLDYSAINRKIIALAEANNIPPIILQAIAFQETGWQQYYPKGTSSRNYCTAETDTRPEGETKRNINFAAGCVFSSVDLGLMQVKVNLANTTESIHHLIYANHDEAVKAQQVSSDWEKNLEAAVAVLNQKWQLNVGDFTGCDVDKSILENWYYPIAWYNGSGAAAYEYVGNVYGYMTNTKAMNATINNLVVEVPDMASPRIIAGFSNTIEENPAGYTLAQLVARGGQIHRWIGGSNYQNITNQIGNQCEAAANDQPKNPSKVTGLNVSLNGGQVTLSWNKNPDDENIQNYRVSWWTAGDPIHFQNSNPIAGTSWTQAFNPGSYVAQVYASNQSSDGLPSQSVAFQVQAQANARPQAVANVRTEIHGRDVTIRWNANAANDNVGFYTIHWRDENTGKSGTLTEVEGTSYVSNDLKDGTYLLSVNGCVDRQWPIPNECGPYSAEVRVVVPEADFAIQCTRLTNNTLLANQVVAKAQKNQYCFQLPAGVQVLTVQMGGEGIDKDPKDADLYLKQGSPIADTDLGKVNDKINPTLVSPWLDGSLESVTLYNPIAGKYYVTIHGSNDLDRIPGKAADKVVKYFLKLHYHTNQREGLPANFNLNPQGLSQIFTPINVDDGTWTSIETQCANGTANRDWGPCNPHVAIDGSSGTGVVQPTVANQRNLGCYAGCRSPYHTGGDWDTLDVNLDGGSALDNGKDLYAALSGTVIYNEYNNHGYGNEVIIQSDMDANFAVRYAHMKQSDVVVGQHIEAGTKIGAVGNTGGSADNPWPYHLHLSLHKNLVLNRASGQAMNQSGLNVELKGNKPDSTYSAAIPLDVETYLSRPTTPRWTTIQAQCPVGLDVVDDQGRHVGQGVFGSVNLDIPGAEYYQVHKAGENYELINLPQDISPDTKIRVMGLGEGEFNLALSQADEQGDVYRNITFLDSYVDGSTMGEIDMAHLNSTNPLGVSTLNGSYLPMPDFSQNNLLQFTNPVPVIESVSASVLADGQRLVINGDGFGNLSETLPGEIDMIDGNDLYRPFQIVSWNDHQITADFTSTLIPMNKSYELRVLVYPSRVVSNKVSMDVVASDTLPVLQDVRPLFAIANLNDQPAEFFGLGFDSQAQVSIGGALLLKKDVDSSGHIHGALPALNVGPKLVVVTNGNGMASAENFSIQFLPGGGDLDGDGLTNADELAGGFDVTNPDTDGDGVADGLDALPGDPTETLDADGDNIGDHLDPDDDNDGVADTLDICPATDPENPVNGEGCAANQRGCGLLGDVAGNRFETELCALVDAGLFPLPPQAATLGPDDPITLQEEIELIVNVAGFKEEALAAMNGPCPGNPYFNFAIVRRILKPSAPGCPASNSEQGLYRPILESVRALLQKSDDESNYFYMIASQYDGPNLGNLTNPYWIVRDYFKYAYEMGALPDFDEGIDPSDNTYGAQTVTRAQAAFIVYHLFHMDGLPERVDLPESIGLLTDAQASFGLRIPYEPSYPMQRGDFLGLALRMMREEGCVNYLDNAPNPFINVPNDYEFLPELIKAVEMKLIKNGEGLSGNNVDGLSINYFAYLTRRVESIFLYRLRAGVGACRENCTLIANRERNHIHFSPQDPTALQFEPYATCGYSLGAYPLSEIGGDGLINLHFEEVPEAKESLITLYNMLEVDANP